MDVGVWLIGITVANNMFSVAVVMLMRNRKLENIGVKVQKGKKNDLGFSGV